MSVDATVLLVTVNGQVLEQVLAVVKYIGSTIDSTIDSSGS